MVDAPVRRQATIEDVAVLAGVSRAAVSKVLRNAYGVSDAMRERVTAAMTELDYRPRIAARAMRGSTFTIGVELPYLSNQFFSRMLTGIVDSLAGTPYQIVIAPAGDADHVQRAIEALVDRQVDGVIAVAAHVRHSALERLAVHTPMVMFGRDDETDAYDSVSADDVAGTAAALDHLIGLGHTRIAHLTLNEASELNNSPHGVRLREYLAIMRAAGLEELVIRTEEGQAPAHLTMRAELERGLPATAVFAGHDELALGAQRALAEFDARISLVGYDDVPMASHPAIGLTTVHQPGAEMGARAIELVLERMAGRTTAVHEIFTPELRVRTSTFPPE